MRRSCFEQRWFALLTFALLIIAATAVAQTTRTPLAGPSPRTPWDHPDLQGVWDFATITPLERPKELVDQEFLTEVEAAALETQTHQARVDAENAPAAGGVGTYNLFWWWEPGGRKVLGSRRTSLIVDPRDGRMPPYTPEAQARLKARAEAARVRPADSPEDRLLSERCIMGFNSGPPMVPGVYLNTFEIVQSPSQAVIVNEMIHNARVIPLDARTHISQRIRQWAGDSRGRWEENTLVIETTNFTDRGTGLFGPAGNASDTMHLVERFTRLDADTLLYRFTVSDSGTWTRPWSVEVPMRRVPGPLFEYACHEGNYGLANILAAARMEEGAQTKP